MDKPLPPENRIVNEPPAWPFVVLLIVLLGDGYGVSVVAIAAPDLSTNGNGGPKTLTRSRGAAAEMSINASVAYVHLNEDGSGSLVLCDRDGSDRNIAGQPRLHFQSAPYEVTALNGLPIWGGSSEIMLGDKKIASRVLYTRIVFEGRSEFLTAVAAYHSKHRND